MANPVETTRVVFVGHDGTNEVWDTSFALIGNAPVSDAAATALADIIQGYVTSTTLDTGLAPLLSTDSGLDKIRVYGYPTGGNVAQSVGEKSLTTPVVGTGTFSGALQICMCVTLLTAQSSRRSRGRMYWPADGQGVTNHLFNTSVQTTFLNGLKSFFDAINADGSIGNVSVVSNVGSTSNEVTALRVDNKPDTQRRRANKLSATVTTSVNLA